MGLIGLVKSTARRLRNSANVTDVTLDPGGGAQLEAQHFGAPGEDSRPLANDYAVAVKVPGADKFVVVGYLDPKNEQTANPGERRLYGRDSGGAVACTVYLQNDGTVHVSNSAGYITLEAGGDVVGNGARMTTGGDVLTSDGISLRSHTHSQGLDSGGDTQQETEAPTA